MGTHLQKADCALSWIMHCSAPPNPVEFSGTHSPLLKVSGMNVFQQWESATFPIVLTFFIITFATAVPVLKGIPRRGNAMFSADAELINGRLAMIGIAGVFPDHGA